MTSVPPRFLRYLEATVRTGSQKEAAYLLGIRHDTLRRGLSDLYRILGVGNCQAAAVALGWTVIPEAR